MRALTNGDTGSDVRALQRALNARAKSRHLPTVHVDGDYGPNTDAAVERTVRALGGMESTIKPRGATIGEQRMIRWPSGRLPVQLYRAVQRKHAASKRAKSGTGPAAALAEARRWLGRTESPPGSNLGSWGLTAWIKHFLGLNFGVPWCGIGVGHCLETAGVKGLTGRVASVRGIYDDAGAGHGGFEKRVPITQGQPGDAVGLYSLSTHVELIEKRVPGGYQTIGFNTSSGRAGSQSNGGGCFRRTRPYSAAVYVARPRYPHT